LLDKIIKIYKSDKIMILHRATTEENVLPFITESFYKNPDYLSTSIDLVSIENHFTIDYQPVYMKFACAIGTEMAPLESNEQFGGMENEMLLGRNNVFFVFENRLSTDISEIENIMGRYYAQGVKSLRIIYLIKFNPS